MDALCVDLHVCVRFVCMICVICMILLVVFALLVLLVFEVGGGVVWLYGSGIAVLLYGSMVVW